MLRKENHRVVQSCGLKGILEIRSTSVSPSSPSLSFAAVDLATVYCCRISSVMLTSDSSSDREQHRKENTA